MCEEIVYKELKMEATRSHNNRIRNQIMGKDDWKCVDCMWIFPRKLRFTDHIGETPTYQSLLLG